MGRSGFGDGRMPSGGTKGFPWAGEYGILYPVKFRAAQENAARRPFMYKRILLKISGEALSGQEAPIGFDKVNAAAAEIASLAQKGLELGIVVGGGNIIRGRDAGSRDRNRMDHMGMLATAINALALQDSLERQGVPCRVLSSVDMNKFCDSYTSRRALELLAAGTVVIFACGTGCPFFSTDTAAALKACEIGADALFLAKNVDAVYSADPKVDKNARPYRHISYQKVIEDNLHATDLTAITLCREQHMPIKCFALEKLHEALESENIGTLIDEDGAEACI